MINEEMKELLVKSLKIAVEESREVRIETKTEGYTLSSYQDKIGILQSIGYYMGEHCDGRHGWISLSIKGRDKSCEGCWKDEGFLYINLFKINSLFIQVYPPYKNVTNITINNTLNIYIK